MLNKWNRCEHLARFGLIASLLLIALVGCSSKSSIAQVKGKVLLDDKPLAKGSIVTLPGSGRGAHGIISNGEFELGTYTSNDGALIGSHKVAVVVVEPPQGAGAEAAGGKLLIPQRYTNPDTSGLTVEVNAGEVNTPTLKLTSQ